MNRNRRIDICCSRLPFRLLTCCLLALLAAAQAAPALAQAVATAQQSGQPALSGRVITREKEEVPYATVRLKGTSHHPHGH